MKLDLEERFGPDARDLRRPISQRPRSSLGTEEFVRRGSFFYHQRNRADRELMRWVCEAARRELHLEEGLESIERWIARTFGWSYTRSAEYLRVAQCLEEYALLDDAFMSGTLSYDHLRALSLVATEDNQAELIQQASGASVSHAFLLAKRLLKLGVDDSISARSFRGCELRIDYENRLYLINAQLAEEEGAALFKAIDKIAGQIPDDPDDSPTSMSKKRADALAALAKGISGSGSPGYQVIVEVDAKDLIAGHGVAEIAGGTTVSPTVVDRLLCDSLVRTVVNGPDGTPIAEGRPRRAVPSWAKRKLELRDPVCRFNGCTTRIFLEHHHAGIASIDGGPETPDNLMMLCPTHHRFVHDKKWSIKGQPPRTWLERPGRPPLVNGPPPLSVA